MQSSQSSLSIETAEIVALQALAFVAANERLGPRLLTLTGLDATTLRECASTHEVMAATLEFLAAHEADLVECAAAIGRPAEDIARARLVLLR